MKMAKLKSTGSAVLILSGPVHCKGWHVYLTLEWGWYPRLRVRPTDALALV